ncbi:MAG: cytochrome c5 family protein [Burkholderiaceae bacterium]|nr:cytochrome c5 family protein [Burkholderiaceae bacterium]
MLKPWFALCALFLTLGAIAEPSPRQMALFNNNCVQCHLRPGVGAPLVGKAQDWQTRKAQGEDALLRHVVEGLKGMPPLGYCSACSEADFRALIRFMAGMPAGTGQ